MYADAGMYEIKRTVCPVTVSVYFENAYCALVSHALFGDAYDTLVVIAKRYPFNGCWELPNVQTFAVRDVPETKLIVC
jgi:hypothetical protein